MSKHRPFASCRFCPKCGVASILRDPRHDGTKAHKVEYVCMICGFAFVIGPSNSYAQAVQLAARERTIRDRNFHENVTQETRVAFERNNPEPLKFKLWRFVRRLQGIKPDGK